MRRRPGNGCQWTRTLAGLTSAEVVQRRSTYGPNRLAEEPPEPGGRLVLRQHTDLMQLVPVGAARRECRLAARDADHHRQGETGRSARPSARLTWLDNPDKLWKFKASDLDDRAL